MCLSRPLVCGVSIVRVCLILGFVGSVSCVSACVLWVSIVCESASFSGLCGQYRVSASDLLGQCCVCLPHPVVL